MNFRVLHLKWFPNWQIGLSEDRGRAKFAENLRASPFNNDLSNEATFSLIHLDGQYL